MPLRRAFSTEVIPRQDAQMQQLADPKIFPQQWVTKLSNRSVLSIRGSDAMELLQNTSTNDMKIFDESEERAAIYTSFLSVKGKTLMDAIVVKPRLASQSSDDMEYWLDLHQEDIDPLKKHLRRYAMRKNIQIEDISDMISSFSIQTLLGMNPLEDPKEGYFFGDLQDHVEMFESEEHPGHFETDVAAFIDPRTQAQGVRVLCSPESFMLDDIELFTDPQKQYDLYRMSIGLPEGASEMGNQFPLNMNLHQLNGVNFNKGCYIGQELTQRTYHTGVVRKVALPFLVDSKPDASTQFDIDLTAFSPLILADLGFDIDLRGSEIKDSKGKKLGKVIANRNNLGIALVDLLKLTASGSDCEFTLEGHRSLLWQPVWMNVPLQNEEELSAAQQMERALQLQKQMDKEMDEAEEFITVSDVKKGKPPGVN